MGEDRQTESAYLTQAELERIRAELSMGDVWRVRAIEEDDERGAALYWHTARRLGLHDGDMESFLDRVLEADYVQYLLGASKIGTSDSPSKARARGSARR